jgi:hypothetical protein
VSRAVHGLGSFRARQKKTKATCAALGVQAAHDPLFEYHRWLANLRVLQIVEIKALP